MTEREMIFRMCERLGLKHTTNPDLIGEPFFYYVWHEDFVNGIDVGDSVDPHSAQYVSFVFDRKGMISRIQVGRNLRG